MKKTLILLFAFLIFPLPVFSSENNEKNWDISLTAGIMGMPTDFYHLNINSKINWTGLIDNKLGFYGDINFLPAMSDYSACFNLGVQYSFFKTNQLNIKAFIGGGILLWNQKSPFSLKSVGYNIEDVSLDAVAPVISPGLEADFYFTDSLGIRIDIGVMTWITGAVVHGNTGIVYRF